MPPRFLERMQRQSDVLRDVFGDPQNDPPPYPSNLSRSDSSASSFQYRRSRDLSAYQNRLSFGSASSVPTGSAPPYQQHSREQSESTALVSGSPLLYQPSGDDGDGSGRRTSYNFPPPPGYIQATTPTREGFDITAVPRDSLILVTGANSFLGLHIVDQLLQHGYRVRGAVRNAEKAVWTAKLFRDRYGAGRFTTAVIPDMAALHAYDIAVRSCAGVVHVASVTSPSLDPHEVITPSIAGALNALEAAAKEPNVQRVVFTSCASAAVSHDRGVRNVVGGESWNLLDFEDAWGAGEEQGRSRLAAVAASSKMQTEQAVWKWYSQRRPHFALNTILPDTLFGEPLSPSLPQEEQQHFPPSISLLSSLLFNSSKSSNAASDNRTCPTSGHFVSVSDASALHLAALLFPDVRNERIFAVSIPWTRRSLRQILVKVCPEKMVPATTPGVGEGAVDNVEDEDMEEDSMDLTVFTGVERAEDLLRRMGRQGWRDLEGSLRGAVEGVL